MGAETLLEGPARRFSRGPLLSQLKVLDGMMALHLATLHSHHDITLSLLAHPEINDPPIDHSRMPLHLAGESRLHDRHPHATEALRAV